MKLKYIILFSICLFVGCSQHREEPFAIVANAYSISGSSNVKYAVAWGYVNGNTNFVTFEAPACAYRVGDTVWLFKPTNDCK